MGYVFIAKWWRHFSNCVPISKLQYAISCLFISSNVSLGFSYWIRRREKCLCYPLVWSHNGNVFMHNKPYFPRPKELSTKLRVMDVGLPYRRMRRVSLWYEHDDVMAWIRFPHHRWIPSTKVQWCRSLMTLGFVHSKCLSGTGVDRTAKMLSPVIQCSKDVKWRDKSPRLIVFNIIMSQPWLYVCASNHQRSVKKSSAPQNRSTTQFLSNTVHAWVVTESPLQCLH